MQAGRELDKLIAEKVIQKDYCEHVDYIGEFVLCGVCGKTPLAPYSDDIAAAWLVVEYMALREERFHLDLYVKPLHTGVSGAWVGFKNYSSSGKDKPYRRVKVVGHNPVPEAICLAALKALNVTPDTVPQT